MKRRYKTTRAFIFHFRERISIDENLFEAYRESVNAFFQDPTLVSDHALQGPMQGLRSFSLNHEYRIVYKVLKETFLFVDIGTHRQVYQSLSDI